MRAPAATTAGRCGFFFLAAAAAAAEAEAGAGAVVVGAFTTARGFRMGSLELGVPAAALLDFAGRDEPADLLVDAAHERVEFGPEADFVNFGTLETCLPNSIL